MQKAKQTRKTTSSSLRWAQEEFGDAALGNGLRTERLIEMAAAVLRRPDGLVTEVFSESGAREGAYKFLENEKVKVGELTAASCRAAARRARGMPYVFAPVDGSSLTLREYHGDAERGVGSIGSRATKGTGIQVMNTIAISPTGVPLGVLDQQRWVRMGRVTKSRRGRKLKDKETRYWLDSTEAAIRHWLEANAETRLWFQLDRGGDFRELLAWAEQSHHWVTARAAHDRGVLDAEEKYLWATLEAAPLAAKQKIKLPKTKTRAARTATLELRYAKVTLRLRNKWAKTEKRCTLWALLARETRKPTDGTEPVEWLLLSNHPIESVADAKLVLFGYTQRWRVEQFHKTWKSVCKVERTQLRDRSNIERWACILASVAMRLLRLTYLSRKHPELPATEVLSRLEVVALIVEKSNGTMRLDEMLSLDRATLWIAELGGYVGLKASGGPPGTTVLARGLRRLEASAATLGKVLDF